jgi:hypothetical protein
MEEHCHRTLLDQDSDAFHIKRLVVLHRQDQCRLHHTLPWLWGRASGTHVGPSLSQRLSASVGLVSNPKSRSSITCAIFGPTFSMPSRPFTPI